MRYVLPPLTKIIRLDVSDNDGLTPADFLNSSIKSDGGYGGYHNDVSTWFHVVYGALAAPLCGAPLPPNIDTYLEAYINSPPHKWINEKLVTDYALSALAAINAPLPDITLEIDTADPLYYIWHRANSRKTLGLDIPEADTIADMIVSGASGGNINQNADGGFEADPINTSLYTKIDVPGDGQTYHGCEFFPQRSCTWRTAYSIDLLNLSTNDYSTEVDAALTYLQDSKNADGGWGYEAGRESDLTYTHRTARTLHGMGIDITSVAQLVYECQNHDGGFGDRPGWPSRIESTFYACDLLRMCGLNANPPSGAPPTELPVWFSDSDMRIWYFGCQSFGGNYPGEHDFVDFTVLAAYKQGISILSPKRYGNNLIPAGNAFSDLYNLGVSLVPGDEIYDFKLQYNGYNHHDHSHTYMHDVDASGPWAGYRNWQSMGHSFDAKKEEGNRCGNLVDGNTDYITHGISNYQSAYNYRGIDVLAAAIDRGGYNAFLTGGFDADDPYVTYMPWHEKHNGHLAGICEFDNHHTFNGGAWKATKNIGFFIARAGDYAGFWDAYQNGRIGYMHENGNVWGPRFVVDFAVQHGISLPPSCGTLLSCITEPVSDIWGRYSWETWQGGLVVSIWGAYDELRVDGSPETPIHKTAIDCANDIGAPSKYMTSYDYVEFPNIGAGFHLVEIDYDGETEVWEVEVV